MHFNLFDIILLSIFFGSLLLGTYRGLVVTSINIGNFLVALFLTTLLTPLSEEIVGEHVKNSLAITIISIVVAYLLSSFASNWIAKRLKEVIEKHTGGLIDRILGLWLGAIRGYVICLSLFMVAGIISSSSYIGAKNFWQVIHNIDEKQYPKWLKNAAVYTAMQGSYTIADNIFAGSIVENILENTNMPTVPSTEEGLGIDIQKESQAQEHNSSNVNTPALDELHQQLLTNNSPEKELNSI